MDYLRTDKYSNTLIYITNIGIGCYRSVSQIVHMELLQVVLMVVIS
jgi:hypothetical protein